MQRIKDSGKAGVIAYALTEGAFWIGSVPFAIAAVTLLWVLRQVQTGGFQRVGQRVLVSRPNSDLKRLHQRVMSA